MNDRSTNSGRRVLERALARLRRPRRAERSRRYPQDIAFRAVIEERLRNLERQLDEVKGRVNGLIFLLGGAVAVQFVLRLLV